MPIGTKFLISIPLARISHTFRASRQRNPTDTRRAPISAVGGINIPCDAGIKRNAVAVGFRKDSPEGYEKCGLEEVAALLGRNVQAELLHYQQQIFPNFSLLEILATAE